jgi:outer membrane receptor for ferrienterochelin and colicins
LEYGKTWDHYDFNLSLDGRALSQVKTNQYTSNDPNAGTEKVTYPGYTMWNLTLTQRVWKGINVNMAVNNLFNYRPDYYYANSPYTTGTNFSVGLSLDIDQMFRK